MNRVCGRCSTGFSSKHSAARYCSESCRYEARRARERTLRREPEHMEKANAYRRRRMATDPEYRARMNVRKMESYRRLRASGRLIGARISDAVYAEMLAAQGGVCAVCRQPETIRDNKAGGTRRLCIDHDHRNNQVRGLLCSACNAAEGLLRGDPERARSLAAYLESYLGTTAAEHAAKLLEAR